MWPAERTLLYKTVLELKPQWALEIGTWKGGGSTYQIASALKENGFGELVTCEPDKEMHNIAKNTYEVELKGEFPVKLVNDYSHNVIDHLLQNNTTPDFVLMDGPEDPEVCLNDLKALEVRMRKDSIVTFHDWDLGMRADGLISTKSQLVRPYIESSPLWERVEVLSAPISVGFAVYRRK